MEKLSPSEIDSLSRKLFALSQRKQLLENIDSLRNLKDIKTGAIETSGQRLTDDLSIHEVSVIESLINSVNKLGVLKIDVYEGGLSWDESLVTVEIGNGFDELIREVRNNYHVINDQLSKPDNNRLDKPLARLPEQRETHNYNIRTLNSNVANIGKQKIQKQGAISTGTDSSQGIRLQRWGIVWTIVGVIVAVAIWWLST